MRVSSNGLISADDIARIVTKVSESTYAGNVVLKDISTRGRVVSFTIKVNDSRSSGARRSWSGRRMPCACWHAHRDVLSALFAACETATVRTALAVYRGRDGFEETFPETANHNIGSAFQPAYMPDLCDCED